MPEGIRVLVVDDTDHVRKMLRSMLELDGFTVVGDAASGAEAIELCDLVDPDVVVLDYKMPGLDGLATASRIRSRRPRQMVILYTAFIDDNLHRRAATIGITLCIGKVEGLQALEREITRLASAAL
jgi:CheY-like chemotaxis protein